MYSFEYLSNFSHFVSKNFKVTFSPNISLKYFLKFVAKDRINQILMFMTFDLHNKIIDMSFFKKFGSVGIVYKKFSS